MSRLRPHRLRVVRETGGFSVIELLVALAILGTVLSAILGLFASAINSEVDLTKRVRAQEQARLGLDMLRRDVHCASETSGLTVDIASSIVTFILPAGCPSTTTAQVTWCVKTTATPNRNRLYRVPGSSCGTAGGVHWADYLTTTDIFTYTKAGGERAKLNVELLVDLDPATPSRQYALRDALVLRNSLR
jgi:prepilin-type N-terminal cleavage/methylation domain-containing protein